MSDGNSSGRGSPDSVVGATGADPAAEVEQLRRQLEAANLQIQDRDKRLAVADADRHNLQLQVDAQLHDKDRQLAEALQTAEMAKRQGQDMLTELGQTREALCDMRKEREVLQYMQSLERAHHQQVSPRQSAPRFHNYVPQRQQGLDPGQTSVLEVVDQWNSRQQSDNRGQEHHSPARCRNGWSTHGQGGPSLRSEMQPRRSERNISSSSSGSSSPGGYNIPLPRQMTYDGKATWQSFILPFKQLATACDWSEEEKLFRLSNSLREEAAEYAFQQLTPDVVNSFELLELALDARFAEKRTTASYLAQLESRKLQPKEKLSEYVADIKRLVIKGYPTADLQTRDTIGLRHFLKGLPDPQMAIAVGMKDPQTLDEARTVLDTYNSLRDETAKPPRVRAVQSPPAGDKNGFVTEARLQEFGKELKSGIDNQFAELKELIRQGRPTSREDKEAPRKRGWSPRPQERRSPTPEGRKKVSFQAECFACHEMGHYARECPTKPEARDKEGPSAKAQGNQPNSGN